MSGPPDVSHSDLLDEVKALRRDLGPLVEPDGQKVLRKLLDSEFFADVQDGVEIIRAARVGGKGITWLANIIKGLAMIGGVFLFVKAVWALAWGEGG